MYTAVKQGRWGKKVLLEETSVSPRRRKLCSAVPVSAGSGGVSNKRFSHTWLWPYEQWEPVRIGHDEGGGCGSRLRMISRHAGPYSAT